MPTILSTWNEPGKVVMDAATQALNAGQSMLDSIEAGLTAAEEDPNLIAIGRGSLPNSDGELELDASVMMGSDLSAGAVCSMRGILPAIKVARWVMERTPHVMLAGDQARRFAIENGLYPQNLMTATNIERYEEWLQSPEVQQRYVHSVRDTVTMLGQDSAGSFIAASSTSGWSFKKPGRVGDSPIVGAGIYADDEAGAAGATGWGEELWKACASFRTVEAMRNGLTAQEACEQTVRQMMRRQPKSREMACVVLALDKNGGYGAATSKGEFHLWIHQNGTTKVQEFTGLDA